MKITRREFVGAAAAMADFKVAFSQIGQESDWRTANTDSII